LDYLFFGVILDFEPFVYLVASTVTVHRFFSVLVSGIGRREARGR
jgi:hypothetical protein